MAALTATPLEQRGMLAGIFPLAGNFGTALFVALLTAGLTALMATYTAGNPGATEAAAQASALGALAWVAAGVTVSTLVAALLLKSPRLAPRPLRRQRHPPRQLLIPDGEERDEGTRRDRGAGKAGLPLRLPHRGRRWGFTLYIQHESPGGEKVANWLPCPAEDFGLTFRCYQPGEAIRSGAWQAPPVTKTT